MGREERDLNFLRDTTSIEVSRFKGLEVELKNIEHIYLIDYRSPDICIPKVRSALPSDLDCREEEKVLNINQDLPN